MHKVRMLILGTALATLTFTFYAQQIIAQDSPSLGDAARQARLQKQQQKTSQADDSSKQTSDNQASQSQAPVNQVPPKQKKASKVITNEEIPEHAVPVAVSTRYGAGYHAESGAGQSAPTEGKAQVLKAQITDLKNYVASLQSEIDRVNASIHFASGNCVANCVQWNERQLQKQQQVEEMKALLEDQRKQLEAIQESARQQGFGSSVYDP